MVSPKCLEGESRLLKQLVGQPSVIVDAGIGSPKDAAYAMELGADGVLLNTRPVLQIQRPPAILALCQLNPRERQVFCSPDELELLMSASSRVFQSAQSFRHSTREYHR